MARTDLRRCATRHSRSLASSRLLLESLLEPLPNAECSVRVHVTRMALQELPILIPECHRLDLWMKRNTAFCVRTDSENCNTMPRTYGKGAIATAGDYSFADYTTRTLLMQKRELSLLVFPTLPRHSAAVHHHTSCFHRSSACTQHLQGVGPLGAIETCYA
jgi:hypothetical protein